MHLIRLGVYAIVTAAVIALTVMPVSAETIWRLAIKDSIDGVEGIIVQRFADLVEEYTDGEIKVQIFPNEQLGASQATLELLSVGAVTIYAEESSYLDRWAPDITWTSSPFMFDSRDHYIRFLQSDYFTELIEQAEKQAGVTVLQPIGAMLRGPYRVLLTTDPVNDYADVEGTKLRMWDQQLIVDAWSHLGAEVRVLAWSDIYSSVQTGIIEGMTSPVSAVEDMKFTEVAPYIARTNEFYQSVDFMINADALAALDEEERAAVQRAYLDAAEFSHSYTNEQTAPSLGRLQASGATYVELDTAPFVERMRSFYEDAAASGELPQAFFDAVEAARLIGVPDQSLPEFPGNDPFTQTSRVPLR